MLYPDSERRIGEIDKLALLFHDKGYPRTAEAIRGFAGILKGKEVPADFLKRLDLLFDLNLDEFETILSVGQSYRKRCFEEIKEITIDSIGRMGSEFGPALLTLYPLFQRVNMFSKVTGSIAEQLSHKETLSEEVVFHLYCYAYLILVEGIYDELARILYFLAKVQKNNIPNLAGLERMSVRDVLRMFGSTPVFLERWDEKNHIRNAIGHARTNYDVSRKRVRFIDVNSYGTQTFDSGDIPFSQFVERALEIEDSLTAFLHIFLLLKIFDLIYSKNAFQ